MMMSPVTIYLHLIKLVLLSRLMAGPYCLRDHYYSIWTLQHDIITRRIVKTDDLVFAGNKALYLVLSYARVADDCRK